VDTKGLIKGLFVKLTTDEGIVGYSEAGIAFRERALAASIQELKPLLVGRDPFKPTIDGHAVDLLQIDPGRAGGIFEARLVTDMAEVACMPVVVHQPYGPIYDAMAFQLAAMMPNLLAVEWPKHYYPVEPADLRIRLVQEPLTVVGGEVCVPTKPGPGVELDEDAVRRYRADW
jgi:galactonate dehydratase